MQPGFHVLAAPRAVDALWPAARQEAALALLPQALHPEILRFQSAADRQNRTLARLLLQYGLGQHGLEQLLPLWQRDAQERPFFSASSACAAVPDVSCAHAPGLAVVALGFGVRVGIDAEPAAHAPSLAAYSDVFSPAELYFIESSPPAGHPFATLWSRKEALLKLDGRGLNADPLNVSTLTPSVPLYALDIHPGYVCHVAVSTPCQGTLTLLDADFWEAV